MSSFPLRSSSHERPLRFLNDVVYARFPAAYNALDRLTLGVWWGLVREALVYAPTGGRVLGPRGLPGFGPGCLHVELSRRAELFSGIDLAWGMCRFTQRRLQQGLASRLVQGNVFALPYPSNTFDTVESTFTISGLPEATRALDEMARVTAAGGQVVLVDIGLSEDGNRLGVFWARLWERMGDFLYDQASLIRSERALFTPSAGLTVTVYQTYGPGNHIRVAAGQKPNG